MNKIIYIYNDEGATPHGVAALRHMFTQYTPYYVSTLNAAQVIQGNWCRDAAALVMPGGADLPYTHKLNGEGNKRISDYVHRGGVYFGFCAGAYYAASLCDFHRGDPVREVMGRRELGFFKGSAVGPTLAPYTCNSEDGARIAQIVWKADGQTYNAYYNGGCHFSGADTFQNITTLAHYTDNLTKHAAIVMCGVGKGKALLSGVHPEYDHQALRLLAQSYGESSLHYQKIHATLIPSIQDGSCRELFQKIVMAQDLV